MLFIDILLIIYASFLILINLAMLYLFKIFPSLNLKCKIKKEPLVSIIVPAKNEENKIKECINSLLNLNYKNKEIIIVLGRSSDKTKEILKEFKGIKIIEENEIPKGWVGKNWACYLGYKESKGEYLLFTDADTIHSKELLKISISNIIKEKADLITLVPSLIMKNKWIRFFLPIIGQFIFVFTLAPYTNKDNSKRAFGNGQFLLFKRKTYEIIGTHRAVKNKIIEDLSLAKLIKEKGFKIRAYNGLKFFKVNMYENLKEMIKGWSKNMFIGLKTKKIYLILTTLILIFLYLIPIFLIPISLYNYLFFNQINLLTFCIIIYLFYLFRFGIIYYKLNSNFFYSLIFFIAIIFVIYLLFLSYFTYKKGIEWKGKIYTNYEIE